MAKKPGPKPLPANVIRMTGNRSELSEAELAEREQVKPEPRTSRAPKDLSALERECWELHAPELERLALLTVLDPVSFRLLVCQPYEMAVLSRDAMRPRKADGSIDRRKKGLEVVIADEQHGGLRRHPAFLTWRQSIESYRAGCALFGLSPADRVGLRPNAPVGAPLDDDEDDDSAFFGT
jgi:phage terminase small subunit